MLARLWTWLVGLFARRQLFSPAERAIFAYFNGLRTVRADPVVLERRLAATCPDLHKLCALLDLPSADIPGGVPSSMMARAAADQAKAIERLAVAVREAFGCPPLDESGKGLTESECLTLLAEYQDFVADLIEDGAPFPIGPGLTGSSPAQSATEPLPPSGSADGVRLYAEPNPVIVTSESVSN